MWKSSGPEPTEPVTTGQMTMDNLFFTSYVMQFTAQEAVLSLKKNNALLVK